MSLFFVVSTLIVEGNYEKCVEYARIVDDLLANHHDKKETETEKSFKMLEKNELRLKKCSKFASDRENEVDWEKKLLDLVS